MTVTIAASSGAPLTRHWRVAVQGVHEDDEIGPLWSPRVEIFGTKDIVTTVAVPVLTFAGKVRNLDTTRSADNVAMWISIYDRNGRQLTRYIAIPLLQPLAPGAMGTFTVQLPNLPSGFDFHIQVIDKNRKDEDPQQAKALLLQQADAAKRKQQSGRCRGASHRSHESLPSGSRKCQNPIAGLESNPGEHRRLRRNSHNRTYGQGKRQDLAQ